MAIYGPFGPGETNPNTGVTTPPVSIYGPFGPGETNPNTGVTIPGNSLSVVSAASAHEVLIGLVALIAIVVVAVLLAGFSSNLANAMIALFGAFVFLQLLGHPGIFQGWLSAHPIVSGQQ